MQFNTLFLALFAYAYAAPLDARQVDNFGGNAFLQGSHDAMVNAQQVQDTLNNQLRSNSAHSNADRMAAFITGADSQIDAAIATVSNAMAPFTGGLSTAIGNVLLGPYIQAVTNGAEVMLANTVGGFEDRAQAEMVAELTGNYSRLTALASKAGVPADRLINLNKQLINRLPKAKREVDTHGQENAFTEGARDAMINAQQVQDTLNHQLRTNSAHSNADRMAAFITGADSQIDAAIATVSRALAPLTGGASMELGNILLGPYIQAVTNGAEVMLANTIGGFEDRAQAEMVAQLTGNYSRLTALASRVGVPADRLINLNKQLINRLPKEKREVDTHGQENAFTQGARDAMINAQQVQDTLTHQLKANGAHSNADRLVAYITGADSQIDAAIATVSRALAPLTGGASMELGNVLLGPYIQAVTNGAEVMLANTIGGIEDRNQAVMLARLTGNYSRLTALASRVGVPADRLINLNKQLRDTLPKDLRE